MQDIRFLRPDIAIVHFTSNLTGTVRGESLNATGIITLTVARTNGNWEIAAFQNTQTQEQRAQPSKNQMLFKIILTPDSKFSPPHAGTTC